MLHIILAIGLSVALMAADAHAQTSTQKVSTDLRRQYQLVKSTIYEMNKQQMHFLPRDKKEKEIYLVDCVPDEFTIKADDPDGRMASLANEVIEIERTLKGGGYPESVWRLQLNGFEEAALKRFIETPREKWGDNTSSVDDAPLLSQLVSQLSDYRKSVQPNLPSVKLTAACGAGEVLMHVELTPPGGRVLFLVDFYYRLCKAQGLDPYNTALCDRWVEATGDVAAVAGDYRYLAIWPDGFQRSGLAKFNRPKEDGEVIKIRR